MKLLASVLVWIVFASGAFAQTPAPGRNPIQLVQAGGAARGAGLPASRSGAGSTVAVVAAIAIAGVAAAASYQSTVTTPSHH